MLVLVGVGLVIHVSVEAQNDAQSPSTSSPCIDTQAHLLVLGRTRRMHRCLAGRSVGVHRVSLGRGGLDKRAEGDGKTPIGRYTLGKPRRSRNYLRFIPVEYPTEGQRSDGRTGGDIGVHGPPRFDGPVARTLVGANLWLLGNWTDGCIAVRDDEEIESIVTWVNEHQVKLIDIRDE